MELTLLTIILLIYFQALLTNVKCHCNHNDHHIEFGYKNYTEFVPGHECTPIIITVPHGGHLKPNDINDRNYGCLKDNKCVWSHNCGKTSPKCKASTNPDINTEKLAKCLSKEIEKIMRAAPHLILSHLQRSKVDMNSEEDEATFGSPEGLKAYQDFHKFIKVARESVKSPAILFDIHGHVHEEDWTELGYLLKGDTLDGRTKINPNDTSLRALHQRHHAIPFERILNNDMDSLGGILQKFGYKAVPSPNYPGPNKTHYFSGGFITKRYGSRDSGDIDAIQIASPKSLRHSNKYFDYCEALAKGIVKFVRQYYYNQSLTAVYGYRRYAQYIPGSRCSPIILSAPHGGYLEPDNIPDRGAGCFKNNSCIFSHTCGEPNWTKCKAQFKRDQYTLEISHIVREKIKELTGETPHLILSRLKRSKLDPNREKDEATFGVEDSIKAYTDFHNFHKQAISASNGPGLILAIHGHVHDRDDWIELGYLIDNADLDKGTINPNTSSIRALSNRHCSIPFEKIVRGPMTSLGSFLQNLGYKTIPSPDHPGPDGGVYLKGLFTITIYGSRDHGDTDAIQVEAPMSLRQPDTYPQYATDLARALVSFVRLYY